MIDGLADRKDLSCPFNNEYIDCARKTDLDTLLSSVQTVMLYKLFL